MKKIIPVLLGLLGAAALLTILMQYILPLIVLLSVYEVGDELLVTSTSPGGTYTIEAHRINPGATEPFSIQCFRTDGGKKERIYTCRGEEEAEIVWLTEDTVRINTVALNLAGGETYFGDLGKPEVFSVIVAVRAEDVYGLEAEYALGRQPLGGQRVSGVKLPNETVRVFGQLRFDFSHRQAIPLMEQLAQEPFGIVLTVDAKGGVARLPFLYEWPAEWEHTYRFTLTGSPAAGFVLTPDFDGCTVVPLAEALPAA